MDVLLNNIKAGKRGAIAKSITLIENDPQKAHVLLKEIFTKTGNCSIIGITGSAGAGKSSLINKTVLAMKKLGANPAVLAVDPTSHITGGALLGDRVRMTESADSGTYIRSIASRGATGAVSASLRNSVRILEYAGFDPIIIESVGAGQTEVGISDIADVTVVVFNPHTGDSIQAIKAGLTEIGDMYLIHKSDLTGADRLFDAIRDFVIDGKNKTKISDQQRQQHKDTKQSPTQDNTNDTVPVILKTSIKRAPTITKLAKSLLELASASRNNTHTTKRRKQLKAELKDIILNNLQKRTEELLDSDTTTNRYIDQLVIKDIDPLTAGDRITKSILK